MYVLQLSCLHFLLCHFQTFSSVVQPSLSLPSFLEIPAAMEILLSNTTGTLRSL